MLFLSYSNFFQAFPVAPANGNSSVENELTSPRLALAVRIHPIETNGPPMCLRVGVYGTKGMNKTSLWGNKPSGDKKHPDITNRERPGYL